MAVAGLASAFVFLFLLTEVGRVIFLQLVEAVPAIRSEKFSNAVSLLSPLVALVGVASALITFLFSTKNSRLAQQKQHTITILLDTRLSSEFRKTKEERRKIYPEFNDILYSTWHADLNDTNDKDNDRKLAAEALLTLLNHYEFLAVGIFNNDLNERLLKKSLRGIFCNLVDDSRDVIWNVRLNNPKTFEHLVCLYDMWRVTGSRDINGNKNERPIAKVRPPFQN